MAASPSSGLYVTMKENIAPDVLNTAQSENHNTPHCYCYFGSSKLNGVGVICYIIHNGSTV